MYEPPTHTQPPSETQQAAYHPTCEEYGPYSLCEQLVNKLVEKQKKRKITKHHPTTIQEDGDCKWWSPKGTIFPFSSHHHHRLLKGSSSEMVLRPKNYEACSDHMAIEEKRERMQPDMHMHLPASPCSPCPLSTCTLSSTKLYPLEINLTYSSQRKKPN